MCVCICMYNYINLYVCVYLCITHSHWRGQRNDSIYIVLKHYYRPHQNNLFADCPLARLMMAKGHMSTSIMESDGW